MFELCRGEKTSAKRTFDCFKSAEGIRFSAVARPTPKSFHRGGFWRYLLAAQKVTYILISFCGSKNRAGRRLRPEYRYCIRKADVTPAACAVMRTAQYTCVSLLFGRRYFLLFLSFENARTEYRGMRFATFSAECESVDRIKKESKNFDFQKKVPTLRS